MIRTPISENTHPAERGPELTVAHAQAGDAAAIARLHTKSWQTNYRSALPAAFLDDEIPELFADLWPRRVQDDDWTILTARRSGSIVGFAAANIPKPGMAYLDNLHVAPAEARLGVGRRLMISMGGAMANRGVDRLMLTVLTDNHRARRFYARIGGVEGPAFDDAVYGQPVRSHPVEWADIRQLAECPIKAI